MKSLFIQFSHTESKPVPRRDNLVLKSDLGLLFWNQNWDVLLELSWLGELKGSMSSSHLFFAFFFNLFISEKSFWTFKVYSTVGEEML